MRILEQTPETIKFVSDANRTINKELRDGIGAFQGLYGFDFKGEFHWLDGTTIRKISPYTIRAIKNFTHNSIFTWGSLEALMTRLVLNYKNIETEDGSVGAAPDTTRFRASKSGKIFLDKKVNIPPKDYYDLPSYAHLCVKIGGNIPHKEAQELENQLRYALKIFDKKGKLEYSNSDKKPRFVFKTGTNYNTIGIG